MKCSNLVRSWNISFSFWTKMHFVEDIYFKESQWNHDVDAIYWSISTISIVSVSECFTHIGHLHALVFHRMQRRLSTGNFNRNGSASNQSHNFLYFLWMIPKTIFIFSENDLRIVFCRRIFSIFFLSKHRFLRFQKGGTKLFGGMREKSSIFNSWSSK